MTDEATQKQAWLAEANEAKTPKMETFQERLLRARGEGKGPPLAVFIRGGLSFAVLALRDNGGYEILATDLLNCRRGWTSGVRMGHEHEAILNAFGGDRGTKVKSKFIDNHLYIFIGKWIKATKQFETIEVKLGFTPLNQGEATAFATGICWLSTLDLLAAQSAHQRQRQPQPQPQPHQRPQAARLGVVGENSELIRLLTEVSAKLADDQTSD